MKEILKMSTIDDKNNIKFEEFNKMWEKFNTVNKTNYINLEVAY